MNRRGASAEARAQQHLQAAGLTPLARNFQCRLGELDLIMQDRDELVIVEVRSRAAGALLDAASSVSAGKQQRVINTTRHWLSRNPGWAEHALRFDVVALDGSKLHWIRNAFDAL